MAALTENTLSCVLERVGGVSESAVPGLADSALAGRFRHWQGADGRRHLFSVFPIGSGEVLEDVPRFEDAVVLAVARDPDGNRRILLADETGSLPDLFFAGAGLRTAMRSGANEIHVHLLTDSAAGRAAVLREIATR